MALVNGTNYDHIDLHAASGGDVTRHKLQDTDGRAMVAPTEASSTASAAHPAGSYFIYNNKLYQATSDIASGGTITNTNCKEAPLGASVSELKSAFFQNTHPGMAILENTMGNTIYGKLTDSMYDNSGNLITSLNNGYFVEFNVSGGENINAYFVGGRYKNHFFNEFDSNNQLLSYSLKSGNMINATLNSNTKKIKISLFNDMPSYAVFASYAPFAYIPIYSDRGAINNNIQMNNRVGTYYKNANNTSVENNQYFPNELKGFDAVLSVFRSNGISTQIISGGDRVLGYRNNGAVDFTIFDRNTQESQKKAIQKVFEKKYGTILKLESYSGQMYDENGNLIYPSTIDKLLAKKIVIAGGSILKYEETIGRSKNHYFNEFDSNGTLLNTELITSSSFEKTTNQNTAYVLLSIWNNSNDNIAYVPNQKLKVYAFGDSIIQGVVSTGTSSQTYSDYYGYVGLSDDIANNISVTNLGNASGGYLVKGNNNKNGCEIINESTITDADIITIAYGINDYGREITGGLGDETSLAGDGTISGSIRYMIEKAIEKAPNASIVVFTPINCWKFLTTTFIESNDYAINTTGINGFSLKELHDIIVYWANYYKVSLVDWTYANPLINLKNIKDQLLDGLHPNDLCYHKLAYAYLKALPYYIN